MKLVHLYIKTYIYNNFLSFIIFMTTSNPLVSVIIPVYNTESFLDSCLWSVVQQTYKELEIIIVNDGSTDRSEDIINKYRKLDTRIIYIYQKNKGLPSARRTGVDIASGKYIQHLDSDDCLLKDAIESLVCRAESSGADIVNVRFIFAYPKDKKKNELAPFTDFKEITGIQCLKYSFSNLVFWSVWSNFQKRSLYLENSIILVPDISYGEDAILMSQLFLYAHKVVFLDKPILLYNRHVDAMSHISSLTDKKYEEFKRFPLWIKDFLESKQVFSEVEKEFTFLEINNFWVEIMFRKLERIDLLMPALLAKLKQYPDLKKMLSRRKRKLFRYYKFSPLLGKWYLNKCIAKGKL